ncbi:uncharacterized protein LOC122317338 isoform X3 [Carya illinoinensis]|uniref:uncharacterized protein LOC122317338 isoform X3 n=1 Tax=Carya illinoinensis TaxID=32201 RepID=UPI001C7248AA|nr:uncharacterized protein LOC122317338 isoform X3 [Carya illinoinensis]
MVSHCLLWIIIFYYFIKSLPTLSLVLFSFFKPEQPRALLSLALLQPASFLVYHSASPSIAFFPVFFQATKLSSWFCNSRNGFSQKTLATRPSSAKSILPLLFHFDQNRKVNMRMHEGPGASFSRKSVMVQGTY